MCCPSMVGLKEGHTNPTKNHHLHVVLCTYTTMFYWHKRYGQGPTDPDASTLVSPLREGLSQVSDHSSQVGARHTPSGTRRPHLIVLHKSLPLSEAPWVPK